MKVTKTNLTLVIVLLTVLITPQVLKINIKPLAITVDDTGLLTLTANRDVTWLVLDGEHEIIGRKIVLSRPVMVIAISGNKYVIWEPVDLVPINQKINKPVKPIDPLHTLIESWLPGSSDYNKIADNLATVNTKIKAGELSSVDMIMASLLYCNKNSGINKEWDVFFKKMTIVMKNNNDHTHIFNIAEEVCREAAKVS